MFRLAAGVCRGILKAIRTNRPTAHVAYQKDLQAALLHYTRLGHISQVPTREIGLAQKLFRA